MKKNLPILFLCILFTFNLSIKFYGQATLLHGFSGPDGQYPAGDLLSDGTYFYGLTRSGGTYNKGVIFKIKTDGTGYTKLFDFDSINGSTPDNSLTSDGTFLYGTTVQGGPSDAGVIFKIKPDGTSFTKLLDFNGLNGRNPHCTLLYDGTYLYGGAYGGGTSSLGTLFKIKTDGTGFLKLLDFTAGANGSSPKGSLFSDGTYLYGMAETGGTGTCVNGCGIIYKLLPDGSGFSKLMDFTGVANGDSPSSTFISDGTYLYGMTPSGGINNQGVIFKIKPDGTGYSKLFDFDFTNGSAYGALISEGPYLYAMTQGGGTAFRGTIFQIKPDGTSYAKLYDFDLVPGSVGRVPYGSFISDGTFLYGLTANGGSSCSPDCGTIFKFHPIGMGIETQDAEKAFSIYPNPGNGTFTVEFNKTGSRNIQYDLVIYNLLGKIIYRSKIQNEKQEINLTTQSAGVYFMQMQTEKGFTTEKIIIE